MNEETVTQIDKLDKNQSKILDRQIRLFGKKLQIR